MRIAFYRGRLLTVHGIYERLIDLDLYVDEAYCNASVQEITRREIEAARERRRLEDLLEKIIQTVEEAFDWYYNAV